MTDHFNDDNELALDASKTFTAEEVNSIVQGRLSRQETKLEAKYQAGLTERSNTYREALGITDSPGDISGRLATEAAQTARDNADRMVLEKYFGPKSSTKLANDLGMSNPQQYKEYKRRAIELKIIAPKPTGEPMVDTSGYNKRANAQLDIVAQTLGRKK